MNKPAFSFGVIADVQYAKQVSKHPETRPTPISIDKLKTAIDDLNTENLEFLVHLGDLIDRDSSNFKAALDVFSKSKAKVKYVLGNHDFCDADYNYGTFEETLSAYDMTNDTRYYYFDVNNYRFIVLDTNELGIIEHPKGSLEWEKGSSFLKDLQDSGAVNAQAYNGGLEAEQINWLEKAVDQAESKSLNCIIFAHHGLYPKSRLNMLNDDEVLDKIKDRQSIKAFINGHDHEGSYGEINGMHCWTAEAMLDYEDKTAYSTVDVYDHKLVVRGRGRTKSKTFNLR